MLLLRRSARRKISFSLNRPFSRSARDYPVTRLCNINELNYKINDTLNGYVVTKVSKVSDLNIVAIELDHIRTKAKHLHIASLDNENVFSVSFLTPPPDSSGITHVLEHLVLCGSKKFPVRDPFFHMINRSMATYMNAWTASQYTMYPFSTQNAKDYQNLMSVYLDSVFFPNLHELDFLQEGVRLEHKDPMDDKSPFELKGVVYNEMKGALSNSDQIYYMKLLKALFQTSSDGCYSGGYPPLIATNLTREKLVQYHSTHYRPSNSFFFSYGNLDLETTLFHINEDFLKTFPTDVRKTFIDFSNSMWNEEKKIVSDSFEDPNLPVDRQITASMNWAFSRTNDFYEHFSRRIFSDLLIDGCSSPMYKSLIKTHIGFEFSPLTGYHPSFNIPFMSIGLKGLCEDAIPEMEQTIRSTLKTCLKEGLNPKNIDAMVHLYELDRKQQISKFGLKIATGIMDFWLRQFQVSDLLNINSYLNKIAKELKDNSFPTKIITEEFLNGNDSNLFVVKPRNDYNDLREKEKKIIETISLNLNKEERKKIYQNGIRLVEVQKMNSNSSCLPILKIKDIDTIEPSLKYSEETIGRNKQKNNFIVFEEPTNSLVHLKLLFTTKNLSNELLSYLPLFSQIVPKLGAGKRTNEEMDSYLKLWTGKLHFSSIVTEDEFNNESHRLLLLVDTCCLPDNVEKMLSLLRDVLLHATFEDNNTIQTLLDSFIVDLSNEIIENGHSIAMLQSSRYLSVGNSFREELFGITQIEFVKQIIQKNNVDDLKEKLKLIAKFLFNQENIRIAVHSDLMKSNELRFKSIDQSLKSFFQELPQLNDSLTVSSTLNDRLSSSMNCQSSSNSSYLILPGTSNFNAMSLLGYSLNHPNYSTLKVLSKLISSKFLHKEIREKGGAYGSGCVVNNGTISFYSYRDPNIEQTFNNFMRSIKWIQTNEFSQEHLNEAKISVFQGMDSPIPPNQRGLYYFIYNDTLELRQQRRNSLFSVELTNIKKVSNEIFSEKKLSEIGRTSLCSEVHRNDFFFQNWTCLS